MSVDIAGTCVDICVNAPLLDGHLAVSVVCKLIAAILSVITRRI